MKHVLWHTELLMCSKRWFANSVVKVRRCSAPYLDFIPTPNPDRSQPSLLIAELMLLQQFITHHDSIKISLLQSLVCGFQLILRILGFCAEQLSIIRLIFLPPDGFYDMNSHHALHKTSMASRSLLLRPPPATHFHFNHCIVYINKTQNK